MNTKTAIAVVVALVVVGTGFYFFNRVEAPMLPETGEKAAMLPYKNEAFGLSFQYPSTLYMLERNDIGTPDKPQLALFLAEDTQENRDVLEGRNTTPREGPTGIAITVFPNPSTLEASEWAKTDTNWTVANTSAQPIVVNGNEGISYTWSGLYEGRTVVLTKGDKAYVFSVTWLTPEDQIIKDFEMVLNSAVI